MIAVQTSIRLQTSTSPYLRDWIVATTKMCSMTIIQFRIFLYLFAATLATASSGNASGSSDRLNQGHVSGGRPRPSAIKTSPPRTRPPDQWRWDNVGGVNYLTLVKNQHIPQYCGSCWAQAASSSLSDRIKIARKAAWPDVVVAPQVLVSCGPGDGCHGGEAGEANRWIAENGISDETCAIYQAKVKLFRGHDNGLPCGKLSVCESCWPGDTLDDEVCTSPPKFDKYYIDEYADVEGDSPKEQEENMMAEIFHRGPISCGIAVTEALVNYTGGVFVDPDDNVGINHDVSVVGYGVDPDTKEKYWLIRNSWGTYWGERGFFRLRRGVNAIQIESGSCSWATPKVTWPEVTLQGKKSKRVPLRGNTMDDNMTSPAKHWRTTIFEIIKGYIKSLKALEFTGQKLRSHSCIAKPSEENPKRVVSPTPDTLLSDENLPKNWDWRDINGTNYLSWTVNQHVPHYCGSCWAQGTVSALADRFIIADRKKFANLALSAQTIINCRAGGGSCHGGNPPDVYKFAHEIGIPELNCMQYSAKENELVSDCSVPDVNLCRDCTWPPPEEGQTGNCWARQAFSRYFVDEYGDVSGASRMKKEIYLRGPIACGLEVTDGFEKYDGGIYSEAKASPEIDHEISLVGWGFDEATRTEFWIGRNSWGTYWGEYGFFRLKMHKNNLGIEESCFWATPRI